MITETMLLIALRQKNWIQAEEMSDEILKTFNSEHLKTINRASKVAGLKKDAAYLLSLWAEIRWNEINDDEDFT